MLDTCGLGIYLTEQVDVNRIVYGHEVVNSADYSDVVRVVYRCAQAFRVVVDVIVKLLCSCSESVCLSALVDRLA